MAVVPFTVKVVSPFTTPPNCALLVPPTVRPKAPPSVLPNATRFPAPAFSVVAPSRVTASLKVWIPVVVSAPVNVVVPPPLDVSCLIPLKFAPTISVVPLKVRVRSLAAPCTPVVNVGVVPVNTALAPSVTKPV